MLSNLTKKLGPWMPLFLMSSLSLFMELAVIRWVAGEIRLLAYYKNLALLAAFLGLAIGFALVGKDRVYPKGRDYRFAFPSLWILFAGLVIAVGMATKNTMLIYPSGGDEFLWHAADMSFWFSLLMFIGIIVIFFLTMMFLFIPLGQATGDEMARHEPVPAYIVNILASLVGVWAFSLVSYFRTPPVVWFALGLIGVGVYYLYQHKLTWVMGGIFVVSLVVIGLVEPKTIWSPYNRLDLVESTLESDGKSLPWGHVLTVQHSFYQVALNLSEEFIAQVGREMPEYLASVEEVAEEYNVPYLLAAPGSEVLVVGSGTGNDVAAALRAGMGRVDAVEIDPAILDLGFELHPEQPYDDPRVTAIVDDARSFFNKTDAQYDLVVFGFLDSHTLLSSLSSVRLDSFVYTIESFKQAQSHLKEGGYVAVTFATNDWIEERLGRMLVEVFGAERVYSRTIATGTIFIAGENPPNAAALEKFSPWQPDASLDPIPLSTDDWPYIYMRANRIPAGYWQTLLVISVICLALFARSFPETLKPDWHFFLLGAAFLLIEFKSITELALLFGTTWFVNSLAISGVLAMALLANIYVLRTPRIDLRIAYALLFGCLIVGFFFPLSWLAGLPAFVKAVVSMVLLSLPMLFAGVIFSASLRKAGETARPIASNFSGSAVGGMLEYGSIWWGIKSLYLVAIFIYLGAMVAAFWRRNRK